MLDANPDMILLVTANWSQTAQSPPRGTLFNLPIGRKADSNRGTLRAFRFSGRELMAGNGVNPAAPRVHRAAVAFNGDGAARDAARKGESQ